MKKLCAIFLIVLSAAVVNAQVDQDKKLHFLAGGLASSYGYTYTYDKTKNKTKATFAGIGLAMLAGAIKETIDSRQHNNKFDLDEYFNRFEIALQNNPQPIYKLCAPFNSALSHNNFDPKYDKDEGNQRVKNLAHRIHILIQDKIINMFKDWFRKKYVGDEIQVIKIDKELYFHTSRTRTGYRV